MYQEILESDNMPEGTAKIKNNFEELYILSDVSITGATSLSATALGKIHICTGTASDYQVDLPTAVGNDNQIVAIKGAAALTKVVTVVGVSGQTIDGEANRKLSSGGLFVLMSDGANWLLVNEIGSWIPYTPVWTGFSADPTVVYAGYFRLGKQCHVVISINSSGTSNTTAMTATAPFTSLAATINPALIVNAGAAALGRAQTAAGTNIITFFATAAAGAFTASSTKSGNVNFSFPIQ